MTQRLLVLLFVLPLVGALCGPTPTPPPDPPPPLPEAPVGPLAPTEERNCPGTCARLLELGCEEGTPTPGGATCEQVCANALAEGIVLAHDQRCLDEAFDCETARGCP